VLDKGVGGVVLCLELGQILTVHIGNFYQKDNRGSKKIVEYLWEYLLKRCNVHGVERIIKIADRRICCGVQNSVNCLRYVGTSVD